MRRNSVLETFRVNILIVTQDVSHNEKYAGGVVHILLAVA